MANLTRSKIVVTVNKLDFNHLKLCGLSSRNQVDAVFTFAVCSFDISHQMTFIRPMISYIYNKSNFRFQTYEAL